MDADKPEEVNYDKPIEFPDSDEEEGSNLVEVSDETKAFAKAKFTMSLNNEKRKRAMNKFPQPKIPATRTPKLDEYMKQLTPAAARTTDKELAKIQTFVSDAVAPLTALMEAEHVEETLTMDDVPAAVANAVELIGNASARISRLRREKLCPTLNKTLQPLALRDELFKDAAPHLFGEEFAKASKEHVDQVKSIQSTFPRSTRKQFFRDGPPNSRGGYNQSRWGFSNRGRGGAPQRFHSRGGKFNFPPRKTYHLSEQRPQTSRSKN